ncbi:hypothetical protein QTP70_008143 [Hemibagrus guttatus]|uniref:Uncharacterized protein n=1 Tax=Hemibagrus guttatus TaxID=175788 RepID=A0AAE0R738_9TELE|nr:hypothetical protein QTP70_008143 [Hemibagrus guttatus]
MEDEDELGEEEEEEEGLEEDDEKEDEFRAGYYRHGEFDSFDDEEHEGEEMDEGEGEEDDKEEIQALEADNQRHVIGAEEQEAVQSIYEEEGIKDKAGIDEIENICAVEGNESVVGEQQIETHVIGADEEQSEENTLQKQLIRKCSHKNRKNPGQS